MIKELSNEKRENIATIKTTPEPGLFQILKHLLLRFIRCDKAKAEGLKLGDSIISSPRILNAHREYNERLAEMVESMSDVPEIIKGDCDIYPGKIWRIKPKTSPQWIDTHVLSFKPSTGGEPLLR